MVNAKSLVFSHTLLFVAGFTAGKLYQKEQIGTKFRRSAEKVALGVIIVGTFFAGVRVARSIKS